MPFEAEDAAVRQDLCLPRCEGRACQGQRAEIRRPARRLAAESAQERVAAKAVLAELLLRDLRENPAVPYEQDEVTRIIQDDLNERIYAEMQNWTVSDLREWILSETTTTADLRRASRGLTSEMIAAVCKLMSDLDLIYAARQDSGHGPLQHDHRPAGHAVVPPAAEPPDGRCRRHPRLPARGPELRRGDAVIGLNPSGDTAESVRRVLTRFDEVRRRHGIPTQICVLAHVTTQMRAIESGAPPISFSSPSQARRRATPPSASTRPPSSRRGSLR